jgi:hypothetical protein
LLEAFLRPELERAKLRPRLPPGGGGGSATSSPVNLAVAVSWLSRSSQRCSR